MNTTSNVCDNEKRAAMEEVLQSATFLRAYRTATQNAAFHPVDADDFEVLLQAFMLDKAMYELGYELNNRPDWVHIPLTVQADLKVGLYENA